MLASALLVSLLAAAPGTPGTTLIVKREMTDVPEPMVTELLAQIRAGLEHEGLRSQIAPAPCGPELKCVGAAARTANLPAALAVAIARGPRNLVVDLELVDGNDKSLTASTFRVPLKGSPLPPDAADFFHNTALLSAPPPEDDAPRVHRLEPEGDRTVEVQVKPSHPLLKVTAVTTIASGAAGAGLLIGALVVKGQLDTQLRRMPIEITRDSANHQAGLANALGVGSAIALTVCGVAAVATGLLWFQKPGEPAEEE